ncbi:MAG: hypothetical protein J5674_01045 [Candidatus Methanomethylophilaceae archaeon]|nr:hypothetical protein [Candidatus Methanomethylophilaceae archaeon]
MAEGSAKFTGRAGSIHPYAENSMSCVVAFECHSRGYDVVSVPYDGGNTSLRSLMEDGRAAWFDINSGKPLRFIDLKGRSPSELYDEVRRHIDDGKRYMLEFEWFCQNLRHAVIVIHTDRNQMHVFDPLTGIAMRNAVDICGFFSWMKFGDGVGPRLLRIDDLGLDPDIMNDVVQARGGPDERIDH